MAEIQVRQLQLQDIYWLENERKHFDCEALATLAESIRIHGGVKQPIGVVAEADGRYRGLWGQRRLKAAAMAGLATITAIIHPAPKNEFEAAEIRLLENVAREALKPMELANGLHHLMSGGGTAAQVAARVGMSQAAVSRSLSLLKLSLDVQQQIQAGTISADAGYQLAQIDDQPLRDELARQAATGKINRDGLIAARKQSASPVKQPAAHTTTSRVTAKLGGGKSVTIYAPNLDMDGFIQTLEDALTRARQARTKHLSLSTFLRMLSDTARS